MTSTPENVETLMQKLSDYVSKKLECLECDEEVVEKLLHSALDCCRTSITLALDREIQCEKDLRKLTRKQKQQAIVVYKASLITRKDIIRSLNCGGGDTYGYDCRSDKGIDKEYNDLISEGKITQ